MAALTILNNETVGKTCLRFGSCLATMVEFSGDFFDWLVVLRSGISTLFGSFNAELNYKQSVQYKYSICLQLNVKTVLF